MQLLTRIDTPDDLKKISINSLSTVCNEIRSFIIESVLNTGGHLGSSLGCVELAVALHYVFNAPYDKIAWDIGHQAYAHKILTQRKHLFHTLRQTNGISGFSYPKENEYDIFIGGHSSVVISTLLGLEMGLKLANQYDAKVVGVIGDAAIGAGVFFEALNHLSHVNSNMLIVLNDNDMSISKTTGALSQYLAKIKTSGNYQRFKSEIHHSTFNDIYDKLSSLMHFTKESVFFDAFDITYLGPIDGHNVVALVDVLEKIKTINNKVVLLHIITQKGKGYALAENSDNKLHGVEAKPQSGTSSDVPMIANTKIFADSLIHFARQDQKILAVTAAMSAGTGLDSFGEHFPDRLFDVGIAEQHAVAFGAGLAKAGYKPVVCIYSTFMQRAYDQFIHDISLDNLPIRLVLDRAGYVGADGETHAGIYDYTMFLPIPNIVLMVPSNVQDIPRMLELMLTINNAPSIMRFSKNKSPLQNFNLTKSIEQDKLVLGKGEIIVHGKELAILVLGELLNNIIAVNDLLNNNDHIYPTIVDLKFAKPLDETLIIDLATTHQQLVLVYEGMSSIIVGNVYNVLYKHNLSSKVQLASIHCPDQVIPHGSINYQRELAQLDQQSIYAKIKQIFKDLLN